MTKEKKICCELCLSDEDNEIKFGKLFKKEDITVHHFCLLFAPGLAQNGEDHEGIEGFLTDDIKKEIKRVKLLKCSFCKKLRANLGCSKQTCRNAFHTKCAWKNGVNFEFDHSFATYCRRHKQIEQNEEKTLDSKCGICFDTLKKNGVRSILMPCCKNSWFHRDCMQSYALASGSFYFKCPLCGNTDCVTDLKLLGIFIPVRDALWETEDGAFSEFIEPIKLVCESDKCSDKTKSSAKQWKWKLCKFCGNGAVHLKCFDGDENDEFSCRECIKMQLVAKWMKRGTWIDDEEVLEEDEQDENSPPKKVQKLH